MTNLKQVHATAAAMNGYPHPWWFAGGWALDLLLGHVTRDHHDIEIGTLRPQQPALRQHLSPTFTLHKFENHHLLPWPEPDPITPPHFQLQAQSPTLTFDIFLDDTTGDQWTFRRNPAITLPLSQLILHSPIHNLPYLTPEVQLLYKAKSPRPKDEADFTLITPHLSPAQRHWLRQALHVHHPTHPWLSNLAD